MGDNTSNLSTQRSDANDAFLAAKRENGNEKDRQHANVLSNTRENVLPQGVLIPLIGALPGGRELARPIVVRIVEEDCEEGEDREFLVTEPEYHIHAVGATMPEALEAFRRIFSGYLDGLTEREERLSPYMRGQLEYLRSVI
ncbi:MAG TPA: hypothetical protein VN207_06920 [Ktedonobacteraceae bacterium]|nr:hypothetical protein [Ktedonobacteraceae bacterium]